jgi:hypothetical protein
MEHFEAIAQTPGHQTHHDARTIRQDKLGRVLIASQDKSLPGAIRATPSPIHPHPSSEYP